MKKLPLVLALSGTLACSLASAQSSVQIYGRLYPYLISEKTSGATAAGTTGMATLAATPAGPSALAGGIKGMSAGNSALGFRGTEDLGGGLKAKFQIEGTVDVDNGSSEGFRWNRNTFVALEGGFGSVQLGIMDTVFKDYGDTIGVLGVSSGTPMSSSNILRKPGFGTSNNARFHERRPNSIRTWLVGWIWFGLVWFGLVGLGWVGLGLVGWLVVMPWRSCSQCASCLEL